MFHPTIQSNRSQLLSDQEKETLKQVIEIMVLFDIKLLPKSEGAENELIPEWNPDLSKLVTFGGLNSSSRL
jgi:hypothetical protein